MIGEESLATARRRNGMALPSARHIRPASVFSRRHRCSYAPIRDDKFYCRTRPIYVTPAGLRQLAQVQCVFSIGPTHPILPSARHSPILLGSDSTDRPEIADPLSATRLRWSAKEFEIVWPGKGVGIVE